MAETKSKWHNDRIAKLKERVEYLNTVQYDVDYLMDFLKYIEQVHHVNVNELMKDYEWDLEHNKGLWK